MTNETFKKLTTGCFYDRLFAFMDECQINNINVAYSGGGDSGYVDHIDLMFSNKNKMSLDDRSKLNSDVADAFEEELAQPIWDKHGGFADGGGYSVDGQVIYNAKDKTVIISGTDHYWDSWNENENEFTEYRDSVIHIGLKKFDCEITYLPLSMQQTRYKFYEKIEASEETRVNRIMAKKVDPLFSWSMATEPGNVTPYIAATAPPLAPAGPAAPDAVP